MSREKQKVSLRDKIYDFDIYDVEWGKVIKVILIVALSCIIAFNVYRIASSVMYRVDNYDSLYEHGVEVKAQIDELKSSDDGSDVELNSAVSAGSAVASLQNNYSSHSWATDSVDYANNKSELAAHFSSSEGSDNWSNPWFVVNINKVGDNPVWSFDTLYKTSDTTYSVIWTCHMKTASDVLAAYVTADYSAKDDVFSNVVVHVSGTGNGYLNK